MKEFYYRSLAHRCFYGLLFPYVVCFILFSWRCQRRKVHGGIDWKKTLAALEDKVLMQGSQVEHEIFGSIMLDNADGGLLFSKLKVNNFIESSVKMVKYVFYPSTIPFMDSCIKDGTKDGLYSHTVTFLDENGNVAAYIPEQNITVNSNAETIILHTDISLKLLAKQSYYINAISVSKNKLTYNTTGKPTYPHCFQATNWDENVIQSFANLKKGVTDEMVVSLTSDQLVNSIKYGEKVGFIFAHKDASPVDFIKDMIKNSVTWPRVCGTYKGFWIMPASTVLSSDIPILSCLLSDFKAYEAKYAFIQRNNHYKLISLNEDHFVSETNLTDISKKDCLKRQLSACGIHGDVLVRLQDDEVDLILENIHRKDFEAIDRQMFILRLATMVQVLYDIAEADPKLKRDSFGSGSFSIEDRNSILFKKLQSSYGVYSRNPKENKSSHYKDAPEQYGIDMKLNTRFSNLLPHSRGDGHHILFGRVKKGNNAMVTFIKSEPYGIKDPQDSLLHAREFLYTLGKRSKDSENTSRETALPISIKNVINKISYKNYPLILKEELLRCTKELYRLIPFLNVLSAIVHNPKLKSKTELRSIDLDVIQETYLFLKKAVQELQGGEKLLYIRTGNEYVVDQAHTDELIRVLEYRKLPLRK